MCDLQASGRVPGFDPLDTPRGGRHDPSLPYGFNLADLERVAAVIAAEGEHWRWHEEDFQDSYLDLDAAPDLVLQDPPNGTLFGRVITAVGEGAKAANRVEVPFEKLHDLFEGQLAKFPTEYQGLPAPLRLENAGTWWKGSTLAGVIAPLGRAGATKIECLSLGRGTAQHALMMGKTGSGKSTLLHILITNLALLYSPDEIELYLIDFKKGVEFKTYAQHHLPHARVIAIESEREFGLSVLQGLDAELKRRGDLCRAEGTDGMADYRAKTGKTMPRILLLVDEFQEFFTEDDATASQSAQVLDRLVRQGRAFGIHVLLGSQTLAGAYSLARSTIDQMAVRIALQCSEADSRLILADDNPAACLLSRPGEAIYNAANGMVEGNNTFQVAWLTDESRDYLLSRVGEHAATAAYRPAQPQRIFEGNAPADVNGNAPLNEMLDTPGWPAVQRAVPAWLGEPIAIKEPTAARFRRQSGSNLLIVGQDEEAALGMLTTSVISLAAQHGLPDSEGRPGGAHFYLLDFSAIDGPYAGLLAQLTDVLPHRVRVTGRRGLSQVVDEIAAEVTRRTERDETGGPAIYLLLSGVQRARDLRQDEDFSFRSFDADEPAAPNPAKQLPIILRDDPDVGVHTIVWCDSVAHLHRTLDRRSVREFEMRVAFQMGAEDSSNLIDTPAASRLGPYRALFFSEEHGQLEKFRPYGLPSPGWLASIGERLRAKLAGSFR